MPTIGRIGRNMSILRICRDCGLPITDDPRIAREQAVCCCERPQGTTTDYIAVKNIAKIVFAEEIKRFMGIRNRE